MYRALLLSLCLALPTSNLRAQESAMLPSNITFVTSTGYWEESGAALLQDGAEENAGGTTSGSQEARAGSAATTS